MKENLQELLNSSKKREELSIHALNTIRTRHSCVHRVNQFCRIFEESGINELKDIMDKK
jgi:spore maturation protein CgeB